MTRKGEFPDIQINDPRFEYAVKEQLNLPLKTTGRLGMLEIKKLKELSIDNRGIKSLDGIQHFSSLTKLSISDNLLTEVDLSALSKLNELNCSSVFGIVDVKIESELSILICNIEQLNALVKNPLRLKELTLTSNKPMDKLPDLVFELRNIEYLCASSLGLKKIKGIHQLGKLKKLDISNNRISKLNDGITKLGIKMLRIDKNPLELLSIHMSKYYKLIIESYYGFGEMSNDGVCDEVWRESSYFFCSRSVSDKNLFNEFNDYGSQEVQVIHEWVESDLIAKIIKDYHYEKPKLKTPPYELGIDGLPF